MIGKGGGRHGPRRANLCSHEDGSEASLTIFVVELQGRRRTFRDLSAVGLTLAEDVVEQAPAEKCGTHEQCRDR